MKQEVLATMLGIDQTTLSRIENGLRPPNAKTLLRIRELFGETLALSTLRRVVRITPAMRVLLLGPDMVLDTISEYAEGILPPETKLKIGVSVFEFDSRVSREMSMRHNTMILTGELVAVERIGKNPETLGPKPYTHRLMQFYVIDGVIVRDIIWRLIDEEEFNYLGGTLTREYKYYNDPFDEY